jgi:hypothetical protein
MTPDANNDFERKIKSSLEGFEAPYTQGDWEDMDGRLNSLPQSNSSFHFKWKFSTNIYIAIIGCASFLLLMYKLGGMSGTSASVAPKKTNSSNTVSDSKPAITSIKAAPVKNLPGSAAVPPPSSEKNDVSLTDPQEPPVVLSNPSDDKMSEANASSPVPATSGRLKDTPSSVQDPASAPLVSQDSPKVIVFGDQLDPKKGLIYNTKEKVGTGPVEAQTKVNVGWNDYVIYDPNRVKTADTSAASLGHGTANNPSSADNVSGKSDRKRKVGRRGRNSDTTENLTSPEPAVSVPPASSKEGGDTTVKRIKPQNPKFKSDRSILDPY